MIESNRVDKLLDNQRFGDISSSKIFGQDPKETK